MGSGDALDAYRGKRDFGATTEPRGEARPGGSGPPRFVIQEHHATRLHWDLRLEHDGVLVSWALPRGLPWSPGDNRVAAHTEDHPLDYLTFAGEIPAGEYGAGTMTVWDTGTFEVLLWTEKKVEVRLDGERIQGAYALFPINVEDRTWMIHRVDRPQDPVRRELPPSIPPMLATAGSLPEGSDWQYEVKWDGVRALAYSAPGRLRLAGRSGADITPQYPELGRGARALSMHDAILDGEIVALNSSGRPSFAELQSRIHLTREAAVRRQAAENPVTYMIFDLLWLDGHDLTALGVDERRAALEALNLDGDRWRVPPILPGTAKEVLRITAEHGLEGVVAKRRDAPYEPGRRSRAWVKARHRETLEVVVGGWIAGEGRRVDHPGSLLIGVPDAVGTGWQYIGRVGTALPSTQTAALAKRLSLLASDDDPFTSGPARPREAHFCRPRVRCEVAYAERTAAGALRHPVLLRVLEHEDAGLIIGPVRRSGRRTSATVTVDEHTLDFSNPDKILYPAAGTTKREVLAYLVAAAPVLVRHLAGRPLTVRRWPDGVDDDGFFAKAVPPGTPDWVARAPGGPSTGGELAMLVEGAATLAWLANLAALELHVPLALAAEPGRADAVVFDLDPGEPAGLTECGTVAVLIEGMLAGLGLRSVVKTSGSKGLQVYVPLGGDGASFDETKAFSRAVAQTLSAAEPDLVVAQQAKAKRAGRVLVDWMQNDAAKTTVAVYSLRARERPTISTPVEWEEVAALVAGGNPAALVFGPEQVLRRITERGDLFAPLLSLVQTLPKG